MPRNNTLPDKPVFAWVSLDAGDNDPVHFWRYLITACQEFQANAGQTTLSWLERPQQASWETMLTPFIKDLVQTQRQSVLILEDYHHITSPPLHEAITFLLDHLPATFDARQAWTFDRV